jgi:hypothetical protein
MNRVRRPMPKLPRTLTMCLMPYFTGIEEVYKKVDSYLRTTMYRWVERPGIHSFV